MIRKFNESNNSTLTSKNVEYFEWRDIKSQICKEMAIDEKYFRDYHKVIGGSYKDLWHVWLEYFNEVHNGAIVLSDLGERMDIKIKWICQTDNKPWAEPFIKAVYKVWDDNDIEYVKYSW